jgi:hypothetical protein
MPAAEVTRSERLVAANAEAALCPINILEGRCNERGVRILERCTKVRRHVDFVSQVACCVPMSKLSARYHLCAPIWESSTVAESHCKVSQRRRLGI